VPAVKLGELNLGNSVMLDEVCANKKVVFLGVPGAFTPGCSKTHLPGFVAKADEIKAKGVHEILCVATDNAAVMDAWGKDQKAEGKVRMLADPQGELCKALGLGLDVGVLRVGPSFKRFSAIAENGVFTAVNVEPEAAPTGLTCSLAEPLITQLLK
jgi:2-Cys peroxiredoxin 5